MASNTITINRQDTYAKTLNTKDSNGDLIDASGWTIYFTVRKIVADTSVSTDSDAVITQTIPGEASGIHTLTLTPTQTNIDPANYLYDIQIKKSDTDISSSTKASFVIDGDVTRTT